MDTRNIFDIHNSYGSTNCFRFEGVISAFPSWRKAPLCIRCKDIICNWNDEIFYMKITEFYIM